MDNLSARTALSDALPINGEHSLAELPLIGKLNLRGDSQNQNFVNTVETVLGLKPPVEANTVSTSGDHTIFWLGPDEWQVYLPLNSVDSLAQQLRSALSEQHFALTDISDYFSVIELSGPQSREIIASACPFDTREPFFKVGQCAQTRFGHASILLWSKIDGNGFELQIRWSYAQYVYDYLAQSIRNAEKLTGFNTG